jgi:GNAT superfamily N-acetyltransferase
LNDGRSTIVADVAQALPLHRFWREQSIMATTLVNLSERPDLARITGSWRWEAFFSEEDTLADVLAREHACANSAAAIPAVLVLLEGIEPAGMVTLCLDDLSGRPELNPWLAGLYVDPSYRGKGYGRRLITELESLASKLQIKRLSLYSSNAVGLYANAGWVTVEIFDRDGKKFHIMQKHIG